MFCLYLSPKTALDISRGSIQHLSIYEHVRLLLVTIAEELKSLNFTCKPHFMPKISGYRLGSEPPKRRGESTLAVYVFLAAIRLSKGEYTL